MSLTSQASSSHDSLVTLRVGPLVAPNRRLFRYSPKAERSRAASFSKVRLRILYPETGQRSHQRPVEKDLRDRSPAPDDTAPGYPACSGWSAKRNNVMFLIVDTQKFTNPFLTDHVQANRWSSRKKERAARE